MAHAPTIGVSVREEHTQTTPAKRCNRRGSTGQRPKVEVPVAPSNQLLQGRPYPLFDEIFPPSHLPSGDSHELPLVEIRLRAQNFDSDRGRESHLASKLDDVRRVGTVLATSRPWIGDCLKHIG